MDTTITLDDTNLSKAVNFFNIYEFETHFTTYNLRKDLYIGDFEKRKCRFCNQTEPEVFFTKKAHLISQFLGNRHLLSAFECDSCNTLFGDLYEDSFANYLGAYRPFSLVRTSKNNKYPKHKETFKDAEKKRTKLSIQQTNPRHIEMIFEDPQDKVIEFDKDNKKVIVNATRNPYVEIYIYKLLVKMAISMINENEIHSYKKTVYFLRDNSQNDKFKNFGLCRIYIHSIYGPTMFSHPTIYLYRKKKELKDAPHPDKTFILYAANHIYQIFIPLSSQDDHLVGQKITLLPYPILLDKRFYEEGISYDSHSHLYSNHEKTYNDAQQLVFTYDNAIFHNENEK